MTPAGRFTTEIDPTARQALRRDRRRLRHHADPLDRRRRSSRASPGSAVTLVYANRTHRSVMFLDEVHDLKDRFCERLQIVHVLSRETQDVELFSGRLDAARLRAILTALAPADEVDEWFLCGPQQMLAELRSALEELGAAPGSIHSELFHADPVPRAPVAAAGRCGGRRPRRRSASTAAAPTSTCAPTTYPSSRRRCGCAPTSRSPARAASAAPAAPRSSRAPSRWTPTRRSSPTRSSAATSSPASPTPPPSGSCSTTTPEAIGWPTSTTTRSRSMPSWCVPWSRDAAARSTPGWTSARSGRPDRPTRCSGSAADLLVRMPRQPGGSAIEKEARLAAADRA